MIANTIVQTASDQLQQLGICGNSIGTSSHTFPQAITISYKDYMVDKDKLKMKDLRMIDISGTMDSTYTANFPSTMRNNNIYVMGGCLIANVPWPGLTDPYWGMYETICSWASYKSGWDIVSQMRILPIAPVINSDDSITISVAGDGRYWWLWPDRYVSCVFYA